MGAQPDLLALADHFGPWVIIAAVMFWDKREDRKCARQREVDDIDRQKEDRALARERILTDKGLSEAMINLASEVRGMQR